MNENVLLSNDNLPVILRSLDWFEYFFRNEIYRAVSNEITYLNQVKDNKIDLFFSTFIKLNEKLRKERENIPSILSEEIPFVKLALLLHRKDEATAIEGQKEKLRNLDLLEKLDDLLKPIDDILQCDWMKDVKPAKITRIADFLTVKGIDHFHSQSNKIAEREYDEKFHILQSPKLFLSDLEYFRKVCELRGCSMIVAYLDVDNFKKFNTNYGEVEIDRKVLPNFMQTLESFVYHHGYVYRYGGDEYMIILVNMVQSVAIEFLNSMRLKVANLDYQGIKEKTTISIGFCYIKPECFLTSRTIEKKANEAKNFAKDKGKNCIATFNDENFEVENLYVLTHKR